MSTIPAKQAAPAQATETLEERFRSLASVWRAETAYLSSSTDLVAHPAFQEIVQMGPAVIPCCCASCRTAPAIGTARCGGSPPSTQCLAGEHGNIDKAADAWLRWGKEHGYQW